VLPFPEVKAAGGYRSDKFTVPMENFEQQSGAKSGAAN
jgi:hypothetical protein